MVSINKIFLLIALVGFGSFSQVSAQIFMLDNSTIRFFSDALIEDITATNANAQGLINFGDKSFSFRVPIKNFEFAKELMKEHFNENYMESEKFPYGIFKGAINGNFDLSKDGTYEVTAEGVLTIHGVEQKRALPAKLIVQGNVLSLESVFLVKLVDHDVEIPQLVFQNIAEEIEVTIQSGLVPYKK